MRVFCVQGRRTRVQRDKALVEAARSLADPGRSRLSGAQARRPARGVGRGGSGAAVLGSAQLTSLAPVAGGAAGCAYQKPLSCPVPPCRRATCLAKGSTSPTWSPRAPTTATRPRETRWAWSSWERLPWGTCELPGVGAGGLGQGGGWAPGSRGPWWRGHPAHSSPQLQDPRRRVAETCEGK